MNGCQWNLSAISYCGSCHVTFSFLFFSFLFFSSRWLFEKGHVCVVLGSYIESYSTNSHHLHCRHAPSRYPPCHIRRSPSKPTILGKLHPMDRDSTSYVTRFHIPFCLFCKSLPSSPASACLSPISTVVNPPHSAASSSSTYLSASRRVLFA